MRFKIYFTDADGGDDFIVISGATEEEVRERAEAELAKRNATAQYSEEIP